MKFDSTPRTLSRLLRTSVVGVLCVILAGCFGAAPESEAERAVDRCARAPATPHTLYFGPAMRLQNTTPSTGHAQGNAVSSAFLTEDLTEWLSNPVPAGLWIDGDVTVEYWVRSTGTPAPFATNPSAPGQGHHFFIQFGSNRSFQPASASEYSDIAPTPGKIDHYTQVLAVGIQHSGEIDLMPGASGGFIVEAGDRVRLLLTDLALDSPSGGGHDVLFGGDTPSQIRFMARCWPDLLWVQPTTLVDQDVSIPANQGLMAGSPLPPGADATGFNQANFPVQIPVGTDRLSIQLRQTNDANPLKDDVDIILRSNSNRAAWPIGSPYSDESGTLWFDNLAYVFPDGSLTIEVDSYSGVAYEGRLSVVAENARLA